MVNRRSPPARPAALAFPHSSTETPASSSANSAPPPSSAGPATGPRGRGASRRGRGRTTAGAKRAPASQHPSAATAAMPCLSVRPELYKRSQQERESGSSLSRAFRRHTPAHHVAAAAAEDDQVSLPHFPVEEPFEMQQQEEVAGCAFPQSTEEIAASSARLSAAAVSAATSAAFPSQPCSPLRPPAARARGRGVRGRGRGRASAAAARVSAARGGSGTTAALPRLSARPVLYKSSALERTSPELAFRVRSSSRIAAAAAEADEVREAFKRQQEAAAGCAEEPGDSEEARDAKRYQRRLLLNRHSASASRLRKEAYCASLEKQLAELEAQNNSMVERLRFLENKERDENSLLEGEGANVTHSVNVNVPSWKSVSATREGEARVVGASGDGARCSDARVVHSDDFAVDGPGEQVAVEDVHQPAADTKADSAVLRQGGYDGGFLMAALTSPIGLTRTELGLGLWNGGVGTDGANGANVDGQTVSGGAGHPNVNNSGPAQGASVKENPFEGTGGTAAVKKEPAAAGVSLDELDLPFEAEDDAFDLDFSHLS